MTPDVVNLGSRLWEMATTADDARQAYQRKHGGEPSAVLSWRQWWYAGPVQEKVTDAPTEQGRLL